MCDNEYALSARTMEKSRHPPESSVRVFCYRSGGRFSAFIRSSITVQRAFTSVRSGVQNSRLNGFERQNQHIRDKSKGKGRPV